MGLSLKRNEVRWLHVKMRGHVVEPALEEAHPWSEKKDVNP